MTSAIEVVVDVDYRGHLRERCVGSTLQRNCFQYCQGACDNQVKFIAREAVPSYTLHFQRGAQLPGSPCPEHDS
jgi:hypothetical protein